MGGNTAQPPASPWTNSFLFAGTVAAVGDLVWICVGTNNGAPSGITDSKGNAWNLLPNLFSTVDHCDLFWSVITTALVQNDSITISWSTVPSAAAYSGIDVSGLPNAVLDQHLFASAPSSTNPSSGNVTTTDAIEAMLGLLVTIGPSADAWTAGTGWTGTASDNIHTFRIGTTSGTNVTIAPETETTSSTGTFAATATITSASNLGMFIATFKSGAAGQSAYATVTSSRSRAG